MADALSRNYSVLTPPERFSLMVEALARDDQAEADRLEHTCPRLTYTHNDAEFRDRLQRSYAIALLAMVNLQKHLAVIRCSTVLCEQHALYARGPKLLAACAFLYGRDYGRWECGAIEQIETPLPDEMVEELKDRPDLKEVLAELSGLAEESVLQVAKAVQESIGMGVGEEALSQWEGFCRFCRRCLGVEGLTLLRAYELGKQDPAAEVLVVFPEAKFDEARAAEREEHWAGEWERRFAAR